MKKYAAFAALLLLLYVALSPRMQALVTKYAPVAGPVTPSWCGNGICGGPVPLTPQEKAAFAQADKLDRAAKAAKARGNYALAADYFRAEIQLPHYPVPPWTRVDYALMLDYEGKRSEAFTAYQRGLGPGNLRAGPGLLIEAEANARFGLMCEDRGLHGDACECYYAWRTKGCYANVPFLDSSLPPDTTPAPLMRSLLLDALGVTLEEERPQPNPEAMAAFRASVRLEPNDTMPWIFLGYGLRRAGRFAEAETALAQASKRDKDGHLEAVIARNLVAVRRHTRLL